MLLCIDIGNTNINFGMFDDSCENIACTFAVSSLTKRTPDEFYFIISQMLFQNKLELPTNCCISSVVPSITDCISEACVKLSNKQPFIISAGTRTGFPIKIDIQSQLGSDIVSNAAAAFHFAKPPFAVVDVGTATTVTVVDSSGTLVGTVIAPGAFISLEALSTSCALLYDVSIGFSNHLIGKNSQDSIKSGAFNGHVYMIDGFIERIAAEISASPDDLTLIGTGGMAQSILEHCKNDFMIIPHLTLKGAASLFYHNTSSARSNYTK